MGCWGMGITQSDEYCEVYERFMEDYAEGKAVADITHDLLEEYLEQFEPDDGVLHDVYFALGKAQWMCGGISDTLLERIRQIVENEENIRFYRELEATEKDLKDRRRNLQKFLASLSVPRGKTKKRRIPEEKYVPKPPTDIPLPNVRPGDVFAYVHDGAYRIFGLSERARFCGCPVVYWYGWLREFDQIPSAEQLLEENIVPLGWCRGENFPALEKLTLAANLPRLKDMGGIQPHIFCPDWRPAVWAMAQEKNLTEPLPPYPGLTIDEALEVLNRRRAENAGL